MTDWKPIESAPRDGTPVLVWLKKTSLGSHVHAAMLRPKGKPSTIGHHFQFDVGEPTHWMPIPDPPEEER